MKEDLKKLMLLGISGGLMVAAQSPAVASEANIVSDNYLAAGCGGGHCGGNRSQNTASNDQLGQGYSNQGYYYNQDQNQNQDKDQSYYYQQTPSRNNNIPQSQWNRSNNNSNYNQYPNSNQTPSSNQIPGSNQNSNFNSTPNYNQNRSNSPYFSDSGDTATKNILSEDDFKAKLSFQNKADFDKLSPAAKASAIKRTGDDPSITPDQAVKDAAQADKQNISNSSSRNYNGRF
jgi:hypothetical protein